MTFKKTRGILCALLAVILSLSLTLTAFAENGEEDSKTVPFKITVKARYFRNSPEGASYPASSGLITTFDGFREYWMFLDDYQKKFCAEYYNDKEYFDNGGALILVFGDSYRMDSELNIESVTIAEDKILFVNMTRTGPKTCVYTSNINTVSVLEIKQSDVSDVSIIKTRISDEITTDEETPKTENSDDYIDFPPADNDNIEIENGSYGTLASYRGVSLGELKHMYNPSDEIRAFDNDLNPVTDDNAVLKTGDIIQCINKKGVVINAYYIARKGDVNSDGRITASDAREVFRASAKLTYFNCAQTDASHSLNGYSPDSEANAQDARYLLRISAGLDILNAGKSTQGLIAGRDGSALEMKGFYCDENAEWNITAGIDGKEYDCVTHSDEIIKNSDGGDTNSYMRMFTFDPEVPGLYEIKGELNGSDGKVKETYKFSIEVS